MQNEICAENCAAASSFDKIWNLFSAPVFIQCSMLVILLKLVLTYNEIRIVYELTCLLTAQVLISVQLIRFVLGCLYFLQIACNLIKYKVHKIWKMNHPIWHLEQVGLFEMKNPVCLQVNW